MQIIDSADSSNKQVQLDGNKEDGSFNNENTTIIAYHALLQEALFIADQMVQVEMDLQNSGRYNEHLVPATAKTVTLHFLNTYNWLTPFVDA